MVHAAGSGSQMFFETSIYFKYFNCIGNSLGKNTGFGKTTNTQQTWCTNLPSRRKTCTREAEGFCARLEITYLQTGIEGAACQLWWDKRQLQQHHECPWRKSSSPGHLQEPGVQERAAWVSLKDLERETSWNAKRCVSPLLLLTAHHWGSETGRCLVSRHALRDLLFLQLFLKNVKKKTTRKKEVMKGVAWTRN